MSDQLRQACEVAGLEVMSLPEDSRGWMVRARTTPDHAVVAFPEHPMLLPYVAELLVGKSIGLHGVGNYRIALNVMQSITTLKDSLAAPARNRIAASMVALGEWGMDEARAFVEEEG